MLTAAALAVVAATLVLLVRRVEVRLALLAGALGLCLLAGKPLLLADTFTRGMVAAMVAPICAAVGFARVLALTDCDQQLVRVLVAPLRRWRWLALPGTVAVAYLVNAAISSQAGTAATLGPIVVPLLQASGVPAAVAGAALLVGASFGGDLLHPASQDIVAMAELTHLPAAALSQRIVPASLAGILVAMATFTLLYRRTLVAQSAEPATPADPLRPLAALVPVVPIALLLLAYSHVPGFGWLVALPDSPEWKPLASAVPLVRALLIGVVAAGLTQWHRFPELVRGLFEGMGSAYAGIVSLTIVAQCFGAGVGAVGLSATLLRWGQASGALLPLAFGFPAALALLSGSGSGPILTFAQTFLNGLPADSATERLAAFACFGGAWGRTLSPVAAVVVYCSGLVGEPPPVLLRKAAPAVLAGGLVALLLAAR